MPLSDKDVDRFARLASFFWHWHFRSEWHDNELNFSPTPSPRWLLTTNRIVTEQQDRESYERFAVEDHVHDVITELCEIPNARREFQLGSGIRFDNNANFLYEVEYDQSKKSNPQHPRPDQFCIHRVDGTANTLLTTVEYKPPHKLSVENLRVGLRPMEFWEAVVKPDTISTDEAGKLRHNAEHLWTILILHYCQIG